MEQESTSTEHSFNPGDLIWAKMKGFPPWPAKVLEPAVDMPPNRILVKFFGTLENAFMKPTDLCEYTANRLKYEIPRNTKDFNKAVHEIRLTAGLTTNDYEDPSFPLNEPVRKAQGDGQKRDRRTSGRFIDALLNGQQDPQSKRQRSNSNSTRSRSRASSNAGAVLAIKGLLKQERRRLDSESSNGSRTKKQMISGIPYAAAADQKFFDTFGNDDLSALLGDDLLAGGSGMGPPGGGLGLGTAPDDTRSWRSKRSRASSRIFEDLFLGHRQRTRSGSASASGRRSRLISMSGFSGVSDMFDELFGSNDLDAHAEQFMITLNNMPSEGSVDRPISPELAPAMPGPLEFCRQCGHECKVIDGQMKCVYMYCSKYKNDEHAAKTQAAVNSLFDEEKLDVPLHIPKEEPSSSKYEMMEAPTMQNVTIKQEVMSPPRSSLRIKIPATKKEVLSSYEEDNGSPPRPPVEEKKRRKVQVMSPKMITREMAAAMNAAPGESPRKSRQRPKHYFTSSKVEKTPPIAESGHRHCVFCNGQVRPQMCGGHRHRWRCVDKKCRKWYGWVRANEEIPKNVGRKSAKMIPIKPVKQQKSNSRDKDSTEEAPTTLKRKVGRPSKNDIKIRLKMQKEAAAAAATRVASPQPQMSNSTNNGNVVKRKYTKRKNKDGILIGPNGQASTSRNNGNEEEEKRPTSPLSMREMRYRPSAMEKRARWWTSEKRRVDVSPEREFGATFLDSTAAFKMTSHAVRAAAVTRADEVGTVNGALDLLMDMLVGNMGPLLSLLQELPQLKVEKEMAKEMWNSSAVHIPTFQ